MMAWLVGILLGFVTGMFTWLLCMEGEFQAGRPLHLIAVAVALLVALGVSFAFWVLHTPPGLLGY